ncbi:hypothetical protein pEaSNUABM55_00120 [Erwinia phage pEa_SNUABM_55]|nr:hypothetical protein pEaSNUABM55_00120 [Erwinia phage pEa_SNUABM_55]
MADLLYETLNDAFRPKNLHRYAEHVIKWNAVAAMARGGDLTPLDKQMGFLREEFKETVDALRAGDMVEVVDGVCDMFVVASYAHFLQASRFGAYAGGNLCAYDEDTEFSILALERAIIFDENPAMALKQVVAFAYGLDVNLRYNIGEVLSSNDSKYPTMEQLRAAYPGLEGQLTDENLLKHEAAEIERREGGKYTGVHAVLNEETKQYVFLSDGGKIVKPITFRKPKIIV